MEKSLIIVVDHNVAFNDLICNLIKKMGHRSMQVYTATEAADILFNQQLKPDLLICEVRLSDGSGFDLVRQAILKNFELDVCMISEDGSREDRLETLQLGAMDLISKSLEEPKFTEKIEKIIQQTIDQLSLLESAIPAGFKPNKVS